MTIYDDHWGSLSKHAPTVGGKQNSWGEGAAVLQSMSCDCSNWLTDLASSYRACDAAGKEYHQEKQNQAVMVHWLRVLFNLIRDYVNQFNLSLHEENLLIDYCEPELHRVECSNFDVSLTPRKLLFEGHFVTRQCALLLRGCDCQIDVFVVPSNIWLGLSLNTIDASEYRPFLRLEIGEEETINATIFAPEQEEIHLDTSSLPLLAGILFRQLIESSVQIKKQTNSAGGNASAKKELSYGEPI